MTATTQPSDVQFVVSRTAGVDSDLLLIHGLKSANIIAAAAAITNGTIVTDESLAELNARLANVVTQDELLAALAAFVVNPVTTGSKPAAPTNLSGSASGSTVTLLFTPPATAITLNVLRDGVMIDPTVLGTATSWTETNRPPGTYSYTMSATNAAGTGVVSTAVSVTVAAPPVVPAAPTGPTQAPNGGAITIGWIPAPTGTSQILTRDGVTLNNALAQSVTSYTESPALATGATYVYTIKGVNNAGAGPVLTISVIVPAVASPITLGASNVAAVSGASATTTIVSASRTPTAGKVQVAIAFGYRQSAAPSWTIADGWAGTGGTGTPWGAAVTQVASAGGDFGPVAIFTRLAPASPTAGVVTVTRVSAVDEFWYGDLVTFELTNAASDQLVQAPAVSVAMGATVTATFGQAPDANSIIVAVAVALQASGLPVKPSGYTELSNSQPSGTSAFAVEYKIGSVAQAVAFTNMNTAGTAAVLVVAIELGQVVAAGTTPPGPPTNITPVVTPLAGGLFDIAFTFDPIPSASGTGLNVFEGAVGFTPNPATNQISFAISPGATSFHDLTPRAGSGSISFLDYQFAVYNGLGPGTKSKVTVTIPAISGGASLQSILGFSGEDLQVGSPNSWENGQEVLDDKAKTNTPNAPFVTVWSTHTVGFATLMVNAWCTLSAVGQRLHGLTPVFTITPGFDDSGNAAVTSGSKDADIDAFFTNVQAKVALGQLTNPRFRVGHEFPLAFAWQVTNNPASMASFNASITRISLRAKKICPTAKIDICAFETTFDFSAAIPWGVHAGGNGSASGLPVINSFGNDMYDAAQGAGTTKAGTGMYATYTDPVAAWHDLWYQNGDPANPPAGSNAWQWNLAIAHGLLFTFAEWGLMARQTNPNAGGGDNPYYIIQMGLLGASGRVLYMDYFTAGAHTDDGGIQDSDLTLAHTPNALAQFKTTFA